MRVLVGLLVLVGTSVSGQVTLDPALQPYSQVAGVIGSLNSEGSDTLNNLMTLWSEEFRKLYPSVKIQVQGKGSSTAPAALIAGTAQLGPMSRDMKQSEIEEFEKKYGYPPTRVRVAIDALAVFVHKDNPLQHLSLPQVDAIFSKSRRAGFTSDIDRWGQLSLGGDWADRPISLYGRNSVSGTYGYFKEHALAKGDFKDRVKEQPGSAAVVQGIAGDLYAIGYSGIGYRTSEVKALALAPDQDSDPVSSDAENVYAGKYPLSRFLNVYINKPPNGQADPLTREFLRFVLCKGGQEVVIKDGYLPLTSRMAAQDLALLGVE